MDLNNVKRSAGTVFLFLSVFIFTESNNAVYAELGGSPASVTADAAKFKSKVKKTQSSLYSVHEMTDTYGTVIREYIGSDNTVFAVAWEGKRTPDLTQLFGTYHQRYADRVAEARTNKTISRNRVSLNNSDMVVKMFGHMGSSIGKAYLPDKVPSGFDITGIE